MALDDRVDVVVVGFGMAGAAAALAAAGSGASVLVLDQSPLSWGGAGFTRAARHRALLRAGLRAAAREAGAKVVAQCRAHELMTVGGRVCGVGYAELPRRGAAAAGDRWLRRLGRLLPARPAAVVDRVGEAVWDSGFRVGEVEASAVILAMDSRHWEFVGPAAWTAAREHRAQPGSARPRWPERLPDGPTPELAVREWCASREAGEPVAYQAELRVDEGTGAVLVGGAGPVPGLYAAPGRAHAGGVRRSMMAGLRAGDAVVSALAESRQGRLRAVV
ncbi:FAD-binding protein [Actinocorallia populi]|uniref:FAD-binding protein n=1 Tax=Actinocorallia populi TaxID=2079200 RepID=UPI000D08DCB7|nr:FAD-binding protein [Actinocorallia populi]